MQHPENITAPASTQQAVTSRCKFAYGWVSNDGTSLLSVEPGVPVADALQKAANLAIGIEEIVERLSDATNDGTSPVRCGELDAVQFLAEAVRSLILASKPKAEGGAQ